MTYEEYKMDIPQGTRSDKKEEVVNIVNEEEEEKTLGQLLEVDFTEGE